MNQILVGIRFWLEQVILDWIDLNQILVRTSYIGFESDFGWNLNQILVRTIVLEPSLYWVGVILEILVESDFGWNHRYIGLELSLYWVGTIVILDWNHRYIGFESKLEPSLY